MRARWTFLNNRAKFFKAKKFSLWKMKLLLRAHLVQCNVRFQPEQVLIFHFLDVLLGLSRWVRGGGTNNTQDLDMIFHLLAEYLKQWDGAKGIHVLWGERAGFEPGWEWATAAPLVVLKSPPFIFHVKTGFVPKGGAKKRFETFESFIGWENRFPPNSGYISKEPGF